MTDDTITNDIDTEVSTMIDADQISADQAPYTVIALEETKRDVTMILTHTTTSTGLLKSSLELLADLPGGGTAYLEQELEPHQALKSIKELMDDQMDHAWTEVIAKLVHKPAS